MAGGISFRGFVEQLEAESENARSAEAPAIEEGAEGVRLMSVHTAKGLEFPVVILADMTANLAQQKPERHIDPARGLCAMRLAGCSPHELLENENLEFEREKAEGVRVAYVAATRARDLLVVPAVGDEMHRGWLDPLNKALYPAGGKWRLPKAAEGCPDFGDRTVFNRPVDQPDETSVAPGEHLGTGG